MAQSSSSHSVRGVERPTHDKIDGGRSTWILVRLRGRWEDEAICLPVQGSKKVALSFTSGVLALESKGEWRREPFKKDGR